MNNDADMQFLKDLLEKWVVVLDGEMDASPQQLRDHLAVSAYIHVYLIKRFAERYPAEHAMWEASDDATRDAH